MTDPSKKDGPPDSDRAPMGTELVKVDVDHKETEPSSADKAENKEKELNLDDEELVIYKMSEPIRLTNFML